MIRQPWLILSIALLSSSGHYVHAADTQQKDGNLPTLGEDDGVYKYVCPMHPQIVRDHEGTCPICGMKLVKQRFSQEQSAPEVTLKGNGQASGGNAGVQQEFSIRTAKAETHTLWKYIPTFGKVVADETKVVHIHPRASGWISDLTVRNNGDAIQKGQLLYRIYSPEIVSAQDDYLQVIQNQRRLGAQANSLVNSAKIRLQLLGLDDQTIKSIAKQGEPIHKIPVYAPQTGVVNDLMVQTGMYVQPQTELMSLTDLSDIWVEAEVLPRQQAWLKNGLTVDVLTQAYPGKHWESYIDYLYPSADPVTQAVKVRIPLKNESMLFKPNMLVKTIIYGGPRKNVLAIPLEAVIDDGDTKRVVVMNDKGGFQVKKVVTGMQTQGIVEVLSGIKEGEEIVISGQFLIDSESQVQANLRRLMNKKPQNGSDSPASSAMPSQHQH
ncbi:efflux RND transporter periplasmic adaptor subunit [Thiomicrorhabdus sp. ZW0627]|uniref:efflux RND transporter periplasmic adaptor subunit n=1 Tax=Thiomicrorhabdus sp. ZW0627 TaxID=3039774 RepID=UPI002436612B|nr:efflux RND transporter periplasmic adaptor subunit [Thiomicrorhabdus sp. ZW0627]MDG6774664.1 efflux RND transporter periplasmic adaptor subunit [Thiomicrorhabdus sp. ZW0627]